MILVYRKLQYDRFCMKILVWEQSPLDSTWSDRSYNIARRNKNLDLPKIMFSNISFRENVYRIGLSVCKNEYSLHENISRSN